MPLNLEDLRNVIALAMKSVDEGTATRDPVLDSTWTELDYWIDVCKGLAGHSLNISDNAVKCQEFLHRYWADVPPVGPW